MDASARASSHVRFPKHALHLVEYLVTFCRVAFDTFRSPHPWQKYRRYTVWFSWVWTDRAWDTGAFAFPGKIKDGKMDLGPWTVFQRVCLHWAGWKSLVILIMSVDGEMEGRDRVTVLLAAYQATTAPFPVYSWASKGPGTLPLCSQPQEAVPSWWFLKPLSLLSKIIHQAISWSLKTILRLLLAQPVTHTNQDLAVPDSKEQLTCSAMSQSCLAPSAVYSGLHIGFLF